MLNNHLKFVYSVGQNLTEAPGFTLRLQQVKDVAFTDGTTDIAEDQTLGIQEFNLNLDDSTARATAADDLGNTSQLRGSFLNNENTNTLNNKTKVLQSWRAVRRQKG